MYTFGNNGNEAADQMHFNGELKNDIWLDDCAAILNKQYDERQIKWMTRDGFWEDFACRAEELGYELKS